MHKCENPFYNGDVTVLKINHIYSLMFINNYHTLVFN